MYKSFGKIKDVDSRNAGVKSQSATGSSFSKNRDAPAMQHHNISPGSSGGSTLDFSNISVFNKPGFSSSALTIQPKLHINRPGDQYEQEADAMADNIMQVPGRQLDGVANGTPGIQRKCAACETEEKEELQRKESNGASIGGVSALVHKVLNSSSGKPMDKSTRSFMESRFNHDFSNVKIHDNSLAAKSASSINSLAYTSGSNVVFGDSRYSPNTGSGKRLLAHELTHVVQQGGAASKSAQSSGKLAEIRHKTNAQMISRFVPAEAEVEPDLEIEPEAEVEPEAEGVGPQAGRGSQQRIPSGPERSQDRAYHQSRSFSKMYRAARNAPDYEGAKFELEQPVATLERGGKGPDFITVSSQSKTEAIAGTAAGDRGNINVTYYPHWFHVLDAIESDVSKVTSSNQLLDVFQAYFPESVLALGNTIASRARYGATVSLKWGSYYDPNSLDPDGSVRGPVFVAATKKKTDSDPKITIDNLLKTLIQEWDIYEESKDQERKKRLANEDKGKECTTREVDRKGGNQAHDDYAKSVTGSNKDFEITAPDGKTKCTTDGREASFAGSMNVWEVKTGHEWATSYGIPGAIFAPYFSGRAPGAVNNPNTGEQSGRIYKIEEQRERCLEVTQRCGYNYKYAFASEDAAAFMRNHWKNRPPVVYKKE